MKHNTKILLLKCTIFVLTLFWFGGILTSVFAPALYPASKLFYSHVCHQNENKLIYLFNKPLLVCARCTGIYSGALISSALIFFISTKKLQIKYLLLSALPVLIDVTLVMSGLNMYSKYSAFITGFILGSVTFLYIWNGIEKLLMEKI